MPAGRRSQSARGLTGIRGALGRHARLNSRLFMRDELKPVDLLLHAATLLRVECNSAPLGKLARGRMRELAYTVLAKYMLRDAMTALCRFYAEDYWRERDYPFESYAKNVSNLLMHAKMGTPVGGLNGKSAVRAIRADDFEQECAEFSERKGGER